MTETTPEAKRQREDTAALRQQLFSAGKRNEALSKTLRTARDELNRIKEEARRLTEPPNNWGTLIGLGDKGL
ncbi:MAG: proteasome ATPase, partial [Brevibacterium aurantiacum]|nr:proteasome ATPase [Brevibacterium aurantiacum]